MGYDYREAVARVCELAEALRGETVATTDKTLDTESGICYTVNVVERPPTVGRREYGNPPLADEPNLVYQGCSILEGV